MVLKLFDGKALRDKILASLKTQIESEKLQPCLAIVLLGEDSASLRYIKQKQNAANEIGAKSEVIQLSIQTTQDELEAKIQSLNNDPVITGIIVQLPLPSHIDKESLFQIIAPSKDVDGLRIDSPFVGATPAGIMMLLHEYNIDIKDKKIAFLGSSGFVGKPLVGLFKDQGAHVIEIDEHTPVPYDALVQEADIVVSAVGKPKLVTEGMVKQEAVVIDVGTNVDPETGKLVGDVDFEAVQEKASLITPVPGGVGPMTVASLMKNLVESSKN